VVEAINWGHWYKTLDVAFILSLLVLAAGSAVILWYAKRRPKDQPLTWGEAMVAAFFVFFMMFVAYGIMPHQWLLFADNHLQWRKDKILYGPGNIIHDQLRFTISYEAIRDFVAVGLYVVAVSVQCVLWAVWQRRGQVKPKELPTSAYGRPLVKASPSGSG
jgi:phosphatidylglycerophosphate synthase